MYAYVANGEVSSDFPFPSRPGRGAPVAARKSTYSAALINTVTLAGRVVSPGGGWLRETAAGRRGKGGRDKSGI